jgi:hypothetical protein
MEARKEAFMKRAKLLQEIRKMEFERIYTGISQKMRHLMRYWMFAIFIKKNILILIQSIFIGSISENMME